MATIKGEIPPELEERFREALKGKQKGAISNALIEAIELWLKKHEYEQKVADQYFLQGLMNQYSDRFIIIEKKTNTVVTTGNDIIEVIEEAKKLKPGKQFEIVSRDYFRSKKRQLGIRSKLKYKT